VRAFTAPRRYRSGFIVTPRSVCGSCTTLQKNASQLGPLAPGNTPPTAR